MKKTYLDEVVKPDMIKLLNKKEHVQKQIELFQDFTHNYKIELKEIDNKIEQLDYIIKTVENNPTTW